MKTSEGNDSREASDMTRFVTAPSAVTYSQSQNSPLGRLSLAGEHHDVRGKSMQKMAMRFWDMYAIVYVTAGTGNYESADGIAAPLSAGDLMLMLPQVGYRYEVDSDCRWSEIFIQFQGSVFDLWRSQGLLAAEAPVWHLEPTDYWVERLRHLIRAPDLPPAELALSRVCELQQFLCEAHAHQYGVRHGSGESRWLAEARSVLDAEPFHSTPDWESISATFSISADRFRKKFRALSGQSPYAYFSSRRITRACELLHDPDARVKEVAAECGFEDPFHFSRRFKQIIGIAPSEYRSLATRQ